MNNKLLENVAFQEYEEWKRDILSILSDEPRWMGITDTNLIAKLDKAESEDVPFIASVYRKNNGQWEVDVLHANFYELPREYKGECLGIAERAITIIQNFGKGLSRDNRINRCYKNALTMINATDKQFDGDLEEFIKDFMTEKGSNIVYRLENAYIFTRFDTIDTIYAKIFGLSQKDKLDLEDYHAINNSRQLRELKRTRQFDINEIISRGEKVIPKYLHSEWETCVKEYYNNYYMLQKSFSWNKNLDDETIKYRCDHSLLKVVQLIEDLNRGKDIRGITPRIENMLELALIVKFAKNGDLVAEKVGFAIEEDPKVTTKHDDAENE